MNDLIKVNILSSGRVPWMNISGPRYGISISKRLYTLLKNDPNVRIELADMPPVAPKKETFVVKESIEIKETKPEVEEVVMETETKEPEVEVVDNPVETVEIVEDITVQDAGNELDAAIEAELGDTPVEAFPDTTAEILKEEEAIDTDDTDPVISTDFKKYTKEELGVMTKERLKEILSVERSYTSGEFAPKYADNKTILIGKILKTQ